MASREFQTPSTGGSTTVGSTGIGGARTADRPAPSGRATERPSTGREQSDGHGVRERGVVDLLKELRDEAATLIEKEFDLAKTEIGEKMQQARQGALSLASGGIVLMAGLIITLMGISAGVYALMRAWEMDAMLAGWLAPLAVGLLTLVIGAVMVAVGKKKVEPDALRPHRTERSLRETKEWAERKV